MQALLGSREAKAKLRPLQAFEQKWKSERTQYQERVESLKAMVSQKVDHATKVVKMMTKIKTDFATFEQEENSARPNIPAVFSFGEFHSDQAGKLLKMDFKPLFQSLMTSVEAWQNLIIERITAHNDEVNTLRKAAGLDPIAFKVNKQLMMLGDYFSKLVIDKVDKSKRFKTEKELPPGEKVEELEA